MMRGLCLLLALSGCLAPVHHEVYEVDVLWVTRHVDIQGNTTLDVPSHWCRGTHHHDPYGVPTIEAGEPKAAMLLQYFDESYHGIHVDAGQFNPRFGAEHTLLSAIGSPVAEITIHDTILLDGLSVGDTHTWSIAYPYENATFTETFGMRLRLDKEVTPRDGVVYCQ